jgi:hypothetical protein
MHFAPAQQEPSYPCELHFATSGYAQSCTSIWFRLRRTQWFPIYSREIELLRRRDPRRKQVVFLLHKLLRPRRNRKRDRRNGKTRPRQRRGQPAFSAPLGVAAIVDLPWSSAAPSGLRMRASSTQLSNLTASTSAIPPALPVQLS